MTVPTRRRGPAGWTLRTRLLAALIALLAAVSVMIGLVSVLALNSVLSGRLDDQVVAAAQRAASGPGDGRRERDDHAPPGLDVPGQGEGTLNAQLVGGSCGSSGVLERSGSRQALSAAQCTTLAAVPADGRAHTVDLGGDLGPYRVIAASRDGGVSITGLPLSGVRDTVYRLALIIAGIAAAGLLLAAAAGAAIVRLTLRPLHRVAATATRVSELPLDRGEVALAIRVPDADTDPRTEVGQVGAALNRMLGHVTTALNARHASETRVRQFVADASHELRTPLAVIRGYAELTRRRRDELPADVANALARVESEATRMTSLVEDLLLLARLDAGRPVERAPVDLTRLVVDAVGDAHAAGPGHRWILDLPDEPVVVRGDAARLHQVVANLLGNARTHTPPGRTVTAALAVDGRTATLTVSDDGPGIAPELLPDVFERFARADTSRSRAAGSTGLGLAIVRAVVDAHTGTVAVDSRPGRTAFTVRLPLADVPAPDVAVADPAGWRPPAPAATDTATDTVGVPQ